MPTKETIENTKVFYRIYPSTSPNSEQIKIDRNSEKIYVRHLQELGKNNINKGSTNFWEFQSDGIFLNCDQERVYLDVAHNIVEEVVTKGYTGLVICYGQTQSGKSFTATGLHYSEQEFGLAPRALTHLLKLKAKQPKHIKTSLQLSCMEFSNKNATDLLKDWPNNRVDFYKCRDATRVQIKCEQQALKYMYLAEGRKEYNQQNPQYLSNICTSVITFQVTTKNMELTNPQKRTSRLYIVDLAGNDTLQNYQNFKSQNEVSVANTTKSNLELFSLYLRENIPQNIRLKHRMNSLLYYLDGDFGNESNLRFIGHLRLLSSDLLITLSMLRFGTIFKGVKLRKIEKQFEVNEETELQYLRHKVKEYEKDRHLNSILLNEDLRQGLTEERMQHLNRTVQEYLKNNITQITLMNVTDASLVFKTLKDICQHQETEIKKLHYERQMISEHSEASLKHSEGGSKSSTRSQSNIRSRRSSKKSKDSITNFKKHDSLTPDPKKLKTTTPNLGSKPSSKDSPTELTNKPKKLRISKSSLTRRSSVSKQKSSTTSIEKRNSSPGELSMPLPDTVPENKELWTAYTTQSAKLYKERIDEYKTNEKNIKEIYYELNRDVKDMRHCRDVVDRCCNELLTAQTFRKFNSKDEFDENGFLIISYAEKQCKEQLQAAQNKLVEEQEKALKTQEELKIFLQNRRKIFKKLCDEFDKFCMEQYKIPVTQTELIENEVQNLTFEVDMEKPTDFEEKQEVSIPKPPKESVLLRHLQDLMKKEIEKKRKIASVKKGWKSYV